MEQEYQPLPLKYRPRTWDDLVGQKHASDVLKQSIVDNRIFHSYIFSGVAGSGKTSSARIFAMALNCEALSAGSPCLTCRSCTETLRFRNPDIIEIDGPSHGKVEHVRELREKAIYSPHFNRKVFIIDEAHSLSAAGFEALLKILEEPPAHVVFVLATTNPERIPATIHSRSINLDFRRHDETDVVARLEYISKEEGIELPDESALLIARFADGSLRDSVTVLDQLATSHPGQPIALDLVTQALGIVSGTELHSLMEAVINRNASSLEVSLTKTLERTTEFGMLVRAVADWYRDVLRVKSGAAGAVARGEADMKLLEQFATGMSIDAVDKAIRITWDLADRVRHSGSAPKSFFLTGLYRLMLLAEIETPQDTGVPESHEDLPNVKSAETEIPTFMMPTETQAAVDDLEAQLQALSSDN